MVRSGRRTRRPSSRSPSNACGDVDLVHEVQVDVDQPVRDLVGVPDLVEHRACHIRRLNSGFAPPHSHPLRRPAATTARNGGGVTVIFEVVLEVGVEGDAVACGEGVALAVDGQGPPLPGARKRSARPALVQRRVAGAGRGGAGRQRAPRRPLAGRATEGSAPRSGGRGRLRERRSPARATHDVAALIEAQELRERQLSPAAIRSATARVGLALPRSTCDSIGAETPLRAARSRRRGPSPRARIRTRRSHPGSRPRSPAVRAITHERLRHLGARRSGGP